MILTKTELEKLIKRHCDDNKTHLDADKDSEAIKASNALLKANQILRHCEFMYKLAKGLGQQIKGGAKLSGVAEDAQEIKERCDVLKRWCDSCIKACK